MSISVEQPTIVKKPTEHLHVSYEEYGKLGERLAKIIHDSKWEFDQILCIARGGMLIGDQLSRIFDKPLAITSANSYDGDVQGELTISAKIAMATATLGKKVLLVDDLVDSGATLAAIKQSVEQQFPGVEIKTGVLWKKSCSTFDPDYYADTVEENVWIHQPFEAYDSVSPENLA